jgi:hypothetical protein
VVAISGCISEARAADILIPSGYDGGCIIPGDDAGFTATIRVPPNSQFMVQPSGPVTYRACLIFPDGGPPCVATKTDALIPGGVSMDLCMPSGYSLVSFFVADAGPSTVCAYSVKPKTICQIPVSP